MSKITTTLNPDENDMHFDDSDDENNLRDTEEFGEDQECPLRNYFESYFNMLTGGIHDHFATHLRKSPFIFHLLN